YSCARRFPSMLYVRLDPVGTSGEQVLSRVKRFLAAGLPSAFGFPVMGQVSSEGEIPFPRHIGKFLGGQAVVAVRYDDARRSGSSPKGALLIRNSWGQGWGDGGYGWLPYEYVSQSLAVDFWTLLAPDWLASDEFTRPNP